MSKRYLKGCAISAALAGLFAAGAGAQSENPPQAKGTNWPAYGNDAGAQRYSPLAQITPANVKSLKLAWTYHMKTAGAARVATSQTTPLVVDGVMYLGSPYGKIVALDPVSGKELWAL